ncbi:MAG: isopentenyl-diphosphate Delta-isomerase [Flavobacteriales bacterium]
MQEHVVLVNEKDSPLGLMKKQEAHVKGLLHRAFSVFIFNDKNETLLQQRASEKYHSPLLWTNTCCSHPRDGETYLEGAQRRLQEEMGISCPLEKKFHFIYRADVGHNLIEHELDHVFIGYYNENPILNPKEVSNFKWLTIEEIQKELRVQPKNYTEWFKIIFNEYLHRL